MEKGSGGRGGRMRLDIYTHGLYFLSLYLSRFSFYINICPDLCY